MASAPGDFQQLKQRLRGMWMAGDFGQIARLNEQEGVEFANRLDLKPGMKVLDVACGTGNQSLPAARAGADVTGLDIAPNLLEQARKRAQAEGLKIEFIEGDAEQLPQSSASFDVVMSMFGAMFAPRPDKVASELLRVCRPGGFVAMGNWTPEGFVGTMFTITAKHSPPPPGVPPPVLWGDPKTVAERFSAAARVDSRKRELLFEFPFSPADAVEYFKEYFGPTKMTFARLDASAQEALSSSEATLKARDQPTFARHPRLRSSSLLQRRLWQVATRDRRCRR
jgi:ubiquinone/menaquinone biosynthesis C-methylase UbiE